MSLVVIGAGYVGLPLAIAFSKYFSVVCYDIDRSRIKNLKKGFDVNQQHSRKQIKNKNLIFTDNSNLLKNSKFYIITIPTPIKSNKSPDLRMLKQASILVGKLIKNGSTIIYESTTYPGCTEEFCVPIIEKNSKMKFEKDFFVAYSPERINPGDKINTLKNITKIVGSNNPTTLEKVKNLYEIICKKIHVTSSIKIAESAKVIENTQRDINIALINEFSVLFNKLNIPTNEVLKAAASKWNFHYYKPGLVGGHCISVDPYYLAYKAKKKNYFPKIILAGRQFNESMATYIANQSIKLMKKNDINLKKSSAAILGFSFKENIPDIRNTKVIDIIRKLEKKGIKNIQVFDEVASKNDVKKRYNIKLNNFKNIKKFNFDIIILAVSHKVFLKKISFYNDLYKKNTNKLFVDIKNNYSAKELEKNNYKYFQL